MPWQSSILRLDEPAAADRWRALWESSPQRSVFASLTYVRAVAETFGFRTEMHLTSSEDKRDQAGAITYVREYGPYREAAVPPFTPHSPLILAAVPRDADVNQRTSALEALVHGLEARYGRLRIQLPPSLPDVRVFSWCGWRVRPYYTYIAELKSEHALLDAWSKRTRRTARNELDSFDVEESSNAASAVVQCYVESLGRQDHALPASREQITELIQRLQTGGLARLFVIRDRGTGEPVGGMAMLVLDDTVYYWLGGSRPGPAMTVLLGEMLPRLYRDGIRRIDYAGANTPSIAEFKRQFGGSLVLYFGVEKLNRPALRLLDYARRFKAVLRR